MMARTETSMSSPIMMLWLYLRVSTNMGGCLPACGGLRPEASSRHPAAEDYALVAEQLEAAAVEQPDADDDSEEEAEDAERPARRRRGRRGGRRRPRRKPSGPLEATFDRGEEGYGLWLDPAVQDD